MAKGRGFGSLNPRKVARGKTNYFPFYTYNMKRHRAGTGFSRKMDAEAWLANEKKLIDLGEWTPPAKRREKAEIDPLTVGEWIEEYRGKLEGRLKQSTIRKYEDIENYRILDVKPPADEIKDITRLKDIPLVELTKKDVYRWWDAISAYWNDEGKVFNQKAYVRLKAACAEAVRRDMIPFNPVDIPEAAKRIKP